MPDKTELFIDKAQKVHGNTYDYSQVEYVNARTKVAIICKDHGTYLQTPDNHLRKRGCPKCAGKGWSQKDFIEKAKKVHGDKYSYSTVHYKNKKTHVEIICNVHGSFFQIPQVHLNGSGCPKCAGKNFSFDEIVKKAKKIHGNKYQYLELITEKNKNGKTLSFLVVFCPIHSHIWKATVDAHIQKRTGCNFCGNESSASLQRGNLLDLKERIESIHPKYTVPVEQVYTNQNSNIYYICRYHGKQKGRPINLLNGQGCPVCGQESRNEFFSDDWETVIEKIENKYPNYHVYRDQAFQNHHTPIVYCCDKHGDKITTSNALLSKGAGCDECGIVKRSESQRSLWDDVASKIEQIHDNIIVPRNQEYINTKEHITYECRIHGRQLASPSHLLQGKGCPQCAIENRNNYSDSAWCRLCGDRDAKLYWIKMKYDDETWYKFGKTFQRIKDRWWELKKLGIQYEVLRVVIGEPEYICKLERRVLRFYRKKHYVPSIAFGGHLTECVK